MTLTLTLVGVVSRGSSPWVVVIEGLTHVAVITLGVVLAVTHQLAVFILHTLAGMTVTFAPEEKENSRCSYTHTYTLYYIL